MMCLGTRGARDADTRAREDEAKTRAKTTAEARSREGDLLLSLPASVRQSLLSLHTRPATKREGEREAANISFRGSHGARVPV